MEEGITVSNNWSNSVVSVASFQKVKVKGHCDYRGPEYFIFFLFWSGYCQGFLPTHQGDDSSGWSVCSHPQIAYIRLLVMDLQEHQSGFMLWHRLLDECWSLQKTVGCILCLFCPYIVTAFFPAMTDIVANV